MAAKENSAKFGYPISANRELVALGALCSLGIILQQGLTRLYDRRIEFRCQLLHRDGLCASFRLDHPKQVSKGLSITC